jgi:hypothetical protein
MCLEISKFEIENPTFEIEKYPIIPKFSAKRVALGRKRFDGVNYEIDNLRVRF